MPPTKPAKNGTPKPTLSETTPDEPTVVTPSPPLPTPVVRTRARTPARPGPASTPAPTPMPPPVPPTPPSSQKQGGKTKPVSNITAALKRMAVPIDSLVPDPENARLHPERNLAAIQDSLRLYGQVKPVVVRKATNVIVAGNGTVRAAKALGWTEVAAVFVDMNEVEAAGYGLADNRTAELAKWDFEVVARLDKLLLAAGHESVGWSADELEVLRAADWTPPPVEEGGFGQGGGEDAPEPLMVSFTPDQYDVVGTCIKLVRQYEGKGQKELDQAEALVVVCRGWLAMQPEDEVAAVRGEITENEDGEG